MTKIARQVAALKRACLKLGGDRFQIPGIIERDLADELHRTDWQSVRGPGKMVKSVQGIPMATSQCHQNSALLALGKKWAMMTGMALSDDGCWRAHSWVIDAHGGVRETTTPRTMYYGVVLDKEATKDILIP